MKTKEDGDLDWDDKVGGFKMYSGSSTYTFADGLDTEDEGKRNLE